MTDATLPHVVLAREMVADVQADFPYALLRRAQVAALPALPADNFVEAPSYLVDLGLRRWRDPATLFAGGLARNPRLARRWEELKAGQEPALVMLARAWETGQCSTAAVNAGLESLVMLTGDDPSGRHLTALVDTAVRPVDSPRLATAMATMMSFEAPGHAMQLLDRAATLVRTPVGRFLVELRRVALLIKRLGDHAGALTLIERLRRASREAWEGHVVSAADAAAMDALLLNLRALIEIREERGHAALATMEQAAATMPDDGFVVLPVDMVNRYRSQVRINVVQTLWLSGHSSQAVQRVNAHVMITRNEHPYSMSEALVVAAYINFLSAEHAMALSYCMEAERLVALEGAPTRLAMCRKIAVGALDGLGKRRRAQILARQMVKDPLGDHRLV